MYYRIALVGRIEYVPGNPAFECVDALRRAGHAVECLDPRRYPDVLTKSGALNQPALKAYKERFRPDLLIRWRQGMAADSILDQARAAGEGMPSPAKRFVIYGYVGKDNFGDELIFSILCSRIQERYPEAYFTLVGHGPRATFARHGVTSLRTAKKLEMDYMLNGASALIFMAGIVWDPPFERYSAGRIDLFLNPSSVISGQVGAIMNAHMHGVPAFGLGIGAGPLDNPDAHKLLQLGALCKPVYFARDTEAADLLKGAGIPEELVRQKADIAYTLDVPDASAPLPQAVQDAGEYFLVALREFGNATPEFFDAVGKLIGHAAAQYGLTPVFIDFDPIDRPIHQQVASRLPQGVDPVMYGTAWDFQEVLDLFARSRFSIAMRLHASIISTVMGHPCLALDYNNKVGAQLEDMGLTDNLIAMDATERQMMAALDGMMARFDQDAEVVRSYAAACKEKALEGFQEMFDRVDRRGPAPMSECLEYPRTVSRAELRLADLRKDMRALQQENQDLKDRAEHLEKELEELRAQNQAMKSTLAWKVGSLFSKKEN